METDVEERARPAEDAREEDEGDAEGGAHDTEEARIPGAGDVEKAEDLGGVRHAGDAQADREQETGGESRERSRAHDAPPRTWRLTKTVTTAAAMKTIVATMERGERRAMPQTP